MNYISGLYEGEQVSEVYLCKNKVNAKTKTGKTYYSLTLQDKTGTIDAKIWDLSSGIDHFESMDYIRIDGEVTIYQGANQLNVRRVRVAQSGEYDPADYLPSSQFNIEEMYKKLLRYVDSVKNVYLNELLRNFFVSDSGLVAMFREHSAAKNIHHNFVGGLLQHTLRVVELCDFYCQRYELLQRDLLIAGAMLHDIGKTKELASFPANDYTDEGQLIGHLVIGYRMVFEKIDCIENFPKKLADELGHLILSHHGELEYGSPKKPALIEAVALNLADLTDAKIESMSELLAGALPGEAWLGYQKLWESNVRRTSDVSKDARKEDF